MTPEQLERFNVAIASVNLMLGSEEAGIECLLKILSLVEEGRQAAEIAAEVLPHFQGDRAA